MKQGCLFEKVNKIDKSLTLWTNEMRRETFIKSDKQRRMLKLRILKWTEWLWTLENTHSLKLGNLEEIEVCWDTHNLSKLNLEGVRKTKLIENNQGDWRHHNF